MSWHTLWGAPILGRLDLEGGHHGDYEGNIVLWGSLRMGVKTRIVSRFWGLMFGLFVSDQIKVWGCRLGE